jgi:hypothetical protein
MGAKSGSPLCGENTNCKFSERAGLEKYFDLRGKKQPCNLQRHITRNSVTYTGKGIGIVVPVLS